MPTSRETQAQRYLTTIRQNLERLETLVKEPALAAPEARAQDRRTELLEQIYVEGVVDQQKLFRMLDQRRTPHTWIGAQCRAQFLDTWSAAGGNAFYRVTEKAVEDLSLGRMLIVGDFSALSDPTLATDWDSPEDAAYDNL